MRSEAGRATVFVLTSIAMLAASPFALVLLSNLGFLVGRFLQIMTR